MADEHIEAPRSPCALPGRLRADSACREWVYFWAVHCRASVGFGFFFFLAHPQISEMLFWKIPAWLSHPERREEWSPTRRHLVFRAPGVRGRQPRERLSLEKRSRGLGVGWGLRGCSHPFPLSSLNTNFRNPAGPLPGGSRVVQRPTL